MFSKEYITAKIVFFTWEKEQASGVWIKLTT